MKGSFFKLLWEPVSPLGSLAGVMLLVMATARTAFALVTLGALVWVFCLSISLKTLTAPVMPRRGTFLVMPGIASLLAALYLLIIQILNPVLALETALYILIVPVSFHASRLAERTVDLEWRQGIFQAFLEALVYGVPLAGLSLVREFFGMGYLSLPGGSGGIVEIPLFKDIPFLSWSILGGSAGAFLLLGYGMALIRRFRKKSPGGDAAGSAGNGAGEDGRLP